LCSLIGNGNSSPRAIEISRLPPGLLQNCSYIREEKNLLCIERSKPLGQNAYLVLYGLRSVYEDLKVAVDFAKASSYGELFFFQFLIDNFNAEPLCEILKIF
jgi:hypothetical protein